MDNIIIVYDKLETDFTHYGLAVITTSLDPGPRIFERMNAEYTCEFAVPYTDPAVQYLVEENIVKVDGRLFIIRTVNESRDASGRLLADVFAEHISTELLTEYVPFLQYTNASAAAIINGLFAGTRFTGDATAITTNHDFLVERNYVSWGINHFLALTDGEIKRNNFDITFKQQIGADNGVRISYRKNLKSIKRTKESRGIITRLFVYGRGDLELPEPIDSSSIGLYPRPKCGSITFDDVEDLETLQAQGEAYLATVDTPALAYEADVIELKHVEGWDESEGFELGDTVHIDDEDLGILVTARIVEYEYYPFRPDRSRVTLANFLPSLIDTFTKLQESTQVIEKVITSGGIKSSWIEGPINALKNQLIASGAYASSDVLPNQGFLLENTDINSPDYGALYLGPGIFAIASEKVGGDWNWRTFGKGTGFTADEIRAGILRASVIRIESDGSAYIDGNGFHIDGPDGEVLRMGEFAEGEFGTIAYHTDGSTTALTPAGLIRKTAAGDMPYSYLTAAGSGITGASGSYFNTATDNNGSSIDDVTITLPTDFKGKNFKVFVALKLDSFYTQELKQNPGAGLRVANQAPATTYLDVISKDTTNGTFTVKGYGSLYRWNVTYTVSDSSVVPQYGLPTRHDYALEFTWIAVV